MRPQSLILALPVIVGAVDITHFANKNNTNCDHQADGAFLQCHDVAPDTCCGNLFATPDGSIEIAGLVDHAVHGRDPDSAHIFNSVGSNSCGNECGGLGGFTNACWETDPGCGLSGGAMWRKGRKPQLPHGRLTKSTESKEATPNVAGFWDANSGKHRTLNIAGKKP
jgi:hypothetical protein